MKKITKKEFKKAIALHQKWWDSNGAKGKRADFSGVNFSGWEMRRVNLNSAILKGAVFCNCKITECSFKGATLSGSNFVQSHINDSEFNYAQLDESYFIGARINNVNFHYANLKMADFDHALVYYSGMQFASLWYANLKMADFYCVDTYGADFHYMASDEKVRLPGIICPEEGSFIGFKKATYITGETAEPCIVKLEILEDALRSSSTTRKCRCSKAKVLSITTINGEPLNCEAFSYYNGLFKYRVGEIVEVDNFDTNRWNECAPGIHFFITRQEAVDYYV